MFHSLMWPRLVSPVCPRTQWRLREQRWTGPSFREKDMRHTRVSLVGMRRPAFTVANPGVRCHCLHTGEGPALLDKPPCLGHWACLSEALLDTPTPPCPVSELWFSSPGSLGLHPLTLLVSSLGPAPTDRVLASCCGWPSSSLAQRLTSFFFTQKFSLFTHFKMI